MGKSDEYIEYGAYVRYLRKVTGESDEPDKVRDAVLEKAVEKTEMQMALLILKRLTIAAAVLVVLALVAGGFGYAAVEADEKPDSLWRRSRIDVKGNKDGLRLYEAYEHSVEIREKQL